LLVFAAAALPVHALSAFLEPAPFVSAPVVLFASDIPVLDAPFPTIRSVLFVSAIPFAAVLSVPAPFSTGLDARNVWAAVSLVPAFFLQQGERILIFRDPKPFVHDAANWRGGCPAVNRLSTSVEHISVRFGAAEFGDVPFAVSVPVEAVRRHQESVFCRNSAISDRRHRPNRCWRSREPAQLSFVQTIFSADAFSVRERQTDSEWQRVVDFRQGLLLRFVFAAGSAWTFLADRRPRQKATRRNRWFGDGAI
jgi:hypothetical protein